MAVTINGPVVANTHKVADGSPAPTSELALLSVGNIIYKGRYLVNVLEELFSKVEKKSYAPASVETTSGWQKFTSDGTFIVPEGVTRVLVLCISAGVATSGSRMGGPLVSRYVDVVAGESIPVKVGQSTTPFSSYITATIASQMTSSFNNTVLKATYGGANYLTKQFVIDGKAYAIAAPIENVITEEHKDKGVVTVGAASNSPSAASNTRGTYGTGGFNVERVGILTERSHWLWVARDMEPIILPQNRQCYPDTTQLADTYSGAKGGKGADYGGSAGCWAKGHGYASYGSKGGQGLVCVFWGDDIETKTAKDLRRTNICKAEADGSVTPLVNILDAKDIPYGDGTLESAVDEVVEKWKDAEIEQPEPEPEPEEPVIGFIEQPTLKLTETVTLEVPRTPKHYKKFLIAQILPGKVQETTSLLNRYCTMAAAFVYYEGSEDSTVFTAASYKEDSLSVGYAYSIFAGSGKNDNAMILQNGYLRSSGSSSILDPRPVMYCKINRKGKYGYAIQNGTEEEIRERWLSILVDTPRDSVGGYIATVSDGGAAAWPYSGEDKLPNYSNVYPAGDCTYGYGNWVATGNTNGAFFVFWGEDIDALYDQYVTEV